MSILHHPDEEHLMRYASGALLDPFALAIAVHLDSCPLCQGEVRDWESLGGALLERLAPFALAPEALPAALARIERLAGETLDQPHISRAPGKFPPWLPRPLRGVRMGPELPLGPGVAMRQVWRAPQGPARAFLLRARAGRELPRHGHSGLEMTCVLVGGYSDDDGHYGPGDITIAQADRQHQPRVDRDGECISLIASAGPPRAAGLPGLLMRRFM